jgi:alpha-tubulin suppressor-like RCC1 family protein
MVILSYLDSEEKIIKPYFFSKLAEVNDVRVVLVKQSDKEKLIELMTVLEGKKKLKKKILDGIKLKNEILYNTIIYSWGSVYHGKLGIGRAQYFENNPEFKVATPVTMTKEYYEIANQHAHGKKNTQIDFYYRKFIYTHVPQIVLSNYGKEFKSVACGQNHSVALTSKEGLVYVWGDNTYSQLGIVTQSKTPKYDFPQTPTPAGSLASARECHISSSSTISGGKFYCGTANSKDSFVTIPRLHSKFSDY